MPSPAYWFIPGQSQVWPAKVADLCWRSVSGKILSSIVLSTEERWNKIGRHHSYKTYSLFMKCRNCAEECRESFAGGLLIRAELCRGDACCSATEIPSRVVSGLYEGWLRNHLAFVFSSILLTYLIKQVCFIVVKKGKQREAHQQHELKEGLKWSMRTFYTKLQTVDLSLLNERRRIPNNHARPYLRNSRKIKTAVDTLHQINFCQMVSVHSYTSESLSENKRFLYIIHELV